MADETTNGHSEWSAADFRALREALSRPGIETLPLFGEDQPPITLDLSGLQELVTMGVISNAILAELERDTGAALADLETDLQSPSRWRELTTRTDKQHDLIMSAIVKTPSYVMLDQFTSGRPPESALCLWDFPIDMRWAIMNVMRQGAAELARFREDPRGYAAVLARATFGDHGSSLADPAEPVAPEVLAGRSASDAVAPDAGGTGSKVGGGASEPPASHRRRTPAADSDGATRGAA